MPCTDGRDSVRVIYDKGHDPHYIQKYKDMKKEAKRLSKRCAVLTDLLCKTGRARESKTDIPPEVLKWWEEHCEIDRKRGEPWDLEKSNVTQNKKKLTKTSK